MSIKFFNVNTATWEHVSSTVATGIKVVDLSEHFEADNVNDCLGQLATDMATLEARVEYIYENGTIGGGGGGGGGSSLPTVTLDGADTLNVKSDDIIDIYYFFTSPNPGDGIASLSYGTVSQVQPVRQGRNHFTVGPFTKGSYSLTIMVQDSQGFYSVPLTVTVISGSLELSSTFSDAQDFTLSDNIVIPYTVTTLMSESVFLDYTLDKTAPITVPARIGANTLSIGKLQHMGATFLDMQVHNSTYVSNILRYALVAADSEHLFLIPVTYTPYPPPPNSPPNLIEVGRNLVIDYRVSMKNQFSFNSILYIDDVKKANVTSKPGVNYWNVGPVGSGNLGPGFHKFKIFTSTTDGSSTATIEFQFQIVVGDVVPYQHITENLIAEFDAAGKLNTSVDRDIWLDTSGNNVHCNLYDFNYTTNGWHNNALDTSGKSYAVIDLAPFENGIKHGFTFEVVFKTACAGNVDAKVVSCRNRFPAFQGFDINTAKSTFASATDTVDADIQENTWTKVTYVVNRGTTGTGLTPHTMLMYVNGVISSVAKLPPNDPNMADYADAFTYDGKIYIGKGVDQFGDDNFSVSSIRSIRIYDRALADLEVVTNFIADIADPQEQVKVRELNGLDTNAVFHANLLSIPTMDILCDMSGFNEFVTKVAQKITYNDPKDPSKNFTSDNESTIQWQGTSSKVFPVKNWTVVLNYLGNPYLYTPRDNWKTESKWTLKANYMDSSNANNIGLNKMIYDLLREKKLYPSEVADPTTRGNIDGFPIYLRINGIPQGIYTWQVDRFASQIYGFIDYQQDTPGGTVTPHREPDIFSYEILSNSADGAGAFKLPKHATDPGAYAANWAAVSTQFRCRYAFNPVHTDTITVSDGSGGQTSVDVLIQGRHESLLAMVQWVNDADDDHFKGELAQHWNIPYLIDYYLIAYTFGMVDNLGKNMVFTTWGPDSNLNTIWYPSFYDCDSVLGLDNSGQLRFDAGLDMQDGDYNTSTSNLWTKLVRNFPGEITNRYRELRLPRTGSIIDPWFSFNTAISYLGTQVMDLIGATQYNEDARLKFIDLPEGVPFLYACNGSRRQFTERFLNERFVYMDSVYEANYFAKTFLRTNVQNQISIRIQTYSPEWVKVSFSDATDAKFKKKCNKDHFTEFTYFMTNNTDNNIEIWAADNIMYIDGYSELNPGLINVAQATKLIELDLTGCDRITSLALGSNTYLQRLIAKDCTNLGYQVSERTLDLSGCVNLKEIDISNTHIQSVRFNDVGGVIETCDLSRTDITTFTLIGQDYLNSVVLGGCRDLSTLSITNCRGLETLSMPDTNLSSVILTGCASLQTLDLSRTRNLRTFNISGCPDLRTLVMSGVSNLNLTELNLSYAPLLETFNMSASGYIRFLTLPAFPAVHTNEKLIVTDGVAVLDKKNVNLPSITVRLTDISDPIPATDFTATIDPLTGYTTITLGSNVPDGQPFIYVGYTNNCCLTTLQCDNSAITSLKFGQAASYPVRPDTGYILDLTGIPLKAVNFASCGNLVEVKNINYVATGDSNQKLFDGCINLKTISGYINLTSNCSESFRGCAQLVLPDTGLTLDFTKVTTFWYGFNDCKSLTAANAYAILQACGPATTNFTQCFTGCIGITGTFFQTYPLMFNKCVNATTIWTIFANCTAITGTLPAGLLSYMPNLLVTHAAFQNTGISGPVPNDFFRYNTKLTDCSATFASTKITALPSPQANLFQYNPELNSAEHMFWNCTQLTAQIDANLFIGGTNGLPKLANLEYFFNLCTKVTGPIPRDLFNNITLTGTTNALTTINYFFSGTKVSGSIPAADLSGNKGLLDNCKNLVQVEGLFMNCTLLTGTIPAGLFAFSPKLAQVGYLFSGDTGLTGDIPPDLLRGKTSLSSAVRMFGGCTNIDSEIPSGLVGQGFLDDCPNLIDVSEMFSGCTKLHGPIPARESYWSSTESFDMAPKAILTVDNPDLPHLVVRVDAGSPPLVRDINATPSQPANYKVMISGGQTIISFIGLSPATVLITLPHSLPLSPTGEANLPSDGVNQATLVVKMFDGTVCVLNTDYTLSINGPNIVITRTPDSIIALDQQTIYVTYDRTTQVDKIALLDTYKIDTTNPIVRPLIDTDSGTITTRNLFTTTGAPTAGSTMMMDNLSGVATCVVRVSGSPSYTGVLTPQTSLDGITWTNVSAGGLTNLNTSTTSATIASGLNSVFQFDCTGKFAVRISANAAFTGTAVITMYLSGQTAAKTTDYTLITNPAGYVELTRNRTSTTIHSDQGSLIITYSHTDPDMDARLDLINRSTRPSLIGQFENVTRYGLLDRQLNLTKAAAMFASCSHSGFNGTIPPKLFLGNKITDLNNLFRDCYYLTGWFPPALLHNCTSLINLSWAFACCCNLRDETLTYIIPPGFFDKCTNLTTVNNFLNSENPNRPNQMKLQGILDKDLFRYNIALTNISNMVSAVQLMKGTLDSDLFKYNINLTNAYNCFGGTGITGIGPNLFRTCTLMQDMQYTFWNCSALTGYAPSYWASDHPLKSVTRTTGCFRGATGLSNMSLPTTDPRYIPAQWR